MDAFQAEPLHSTAVDWLWLAQVRATEFQRLRMRARSTDAPPIGAAPRAGGGAAGGARPRSVGAMGRAPRGKAAGVLGRAELAIDPARLGEML